MKNQQISVNDKICPPEEVILISVIWSQIFLSLEYLRSIFICSFTLSCILSVKLIELFSTINVLYYIKNFH